MFYWTIVQSFYVYVNYFSLYFNFVLFLCCKSISMLYNKFYTINLLYKDCFKFICITIILHLLYCRLLPLTIILQLHKITILRFVFKIVMPNFLYLIFCSTNVKLLIINLCQYWFIFIGKDYSWIYWTFIYRVFVVKNYWKHVLI